MDVSFGARLRAERERQRVTLGTIAEQTKIRLPLLEGLEHDDVSHWPSGIFRRSYLRSYAHAIGLDPEETVREFLELYPDPIEESPAALATAHATAGADASSRWPRTRLRYLIDSAIGALPQLRFQAGQKEGETVAVEPARVAPAPTSVAETRADDIPAHVEVDEIAAQVEYVRATPASHDLQTASDAVDQCFPLAVDLPGMASLCTRLAGARVSGDIPPLMADAARILHAVGIILWMWDPKGGALWPSLSHGYPHDVLAQVPSVRSDADNAIAAAFRSAGTRVVDGGSSATGAVVVPVITPTGCAGVLALELRSGGERDESVHALATILAAQLSVLVEAPALARSATA